MVLNGTLKEKKDILKHWRDSIKKIDSIDSMDSIIDC